MSKSCKVCLKSFERSNFKYYCSHNCFLTSSRSSKALVIPCEQCGELVLKYKSQLVNRVFCNRECAFNFGRITVACGTCNLLFEVKKHKTYTGELKTPKFKFCSRHCKGVFDSKNPIGIFNPDISYVKRRSALEIFIENKIKTIFPQLKIDLNNRSLLGLELDFYFFDLNFAIEINGIVHYEPIFGEENFTKVQEKDLMKIKICEEKKIDLLIIKSVEHFYTSVGEKIWINQIQPEIMKRLNSAPDSI